jgi:iron complex outermembrane receptor protein
MKDRYSLSLGKSIANPDLKAENAMNYTLDYSGQFFEKKLKIDAGVFYSHLKDAILAVYGVDATNAQIYQLQNTGKAEFYGFDASASYAIIKPLIFEAKYAYVKRNNLTSPAVKFTSVPENTLQSALTYWFKNKSYLNLNVESYSDRYSTSAGVKVDGFTLLNFKGSYYVYKNLVSVEAGMNNIFDKNYQVSEGYPQMGRNWFASLVFSL